MENVPGLVAMGFLPIITAALQQAGYRISHALLNAADYGAAQKRVRLFIVGTLPNTDWQWPLPTHCQHTPNIWGLPAWEKIDDYIDLNNFHNPYQQDQQPAGPAVTRRFALNTVYPSRLGHPALTILAARPSTGRNWVELQRDGQSWLRPLLSQEGARLQGFPSGYYFAGYEEQVWSIIGNAWEGQTTLTLARQAYQALTQ